LFSREAAGKVKADIPLAALISSSFFVIDEDGEDPDTISTRPPKAELFF
jgi:hypothetical protein